MRARAFAGMLAVVALLAGCTSPPARSDSGRSAPVQPIPFEAVALPATPSPPALQADARSLAGHGELAVISAHRLWLIGAAVKQPRRVDLPGEARDPIWSHDGRWLAVRTSPAPPTSSPYRSEPVSMWLVSRRGHVVRQLIQPGRSLTDAEWSPSADRLVTATSKHGNGPHVAQVSVIDVAGHHQLLDTGNEVSGVAWSPDGTHLAASVVGFSHAKWHSRLIVLSPHSAGRRIVKGISGSVLDLAGWWPDGSGLLAWPDFQGSGSLAADGLPLLEVSLASGKTHRLVKHMLQHPSWIATSRSLDKIAVIDGFDREITLGHKSLAVCTTTRCTRVSQPRHEVSFDPGWSPSGRLTVVRDRAVSPSHGFGPSYIDRIQDSGGVDRVSGSATTPIRGLRKTTTPLWGRDGSMLALRGRQLVLLPAGGHHARRVAGPLRLDFGSTYYGFVPWLDSIAWTDAEPDALAGTD